MEKSEYLLFENEVFLKLQGTEREADLTDRRFSSAEVMISMLEATGERER